MSTSRNPLWDNTRFAAIVFVVLGHTLTKSVESSDFAATTYFWIYSFHIPLFVALSGYFSRESPLDSSRLSRLLTDLFVPYLLLESLWSAIAMARSQQWMFDPLRPSWTLWFLLSLIAWRLALPLIALVRYPLVVSILVGIASGYFAVDQTLSLARTLALLPFFVAGWRVSQTDWADKWAGTHSRQVAWTRIGAIVVLAATALVAWSAMTVLRDSPVRWLLTYDRPYAEAGVDHWWAGAIRLGLYVFAAVIIAALVSVIPRGVHWFSQFGQFTMFVYLLHTFPVAALRAQGILSESTPLWLLVAMIPLSVGLSVLLSSSLVRKITGVVVQPEWASKLVR